MAATKRKHVTLTLKEKGDIIEQLNAGISIKTLSAKYGVGRTTIYDMKNKKDKILKFISSVNNYGRKTLRKPDNPAVEDALSAWIVQERMSNSPLSGPVLAEKARYFYKKITGKNDFSASSGWLDGFKTRHGIRFLKNRRYDTSHIKLEVCNEDDSTDGFVWHFLSDQTTDKKSSTCKQEQNLEENEETEEPFDDETLVFDNCEVIEKEDDDPLNSARISSSEAVKSFENCIKWAEESGCSSTEILLLKHMQQKAMES